MALFILVMTSIPRLKLPDAHIGWEDKIAHFAVYTVFSILVCRSAAAVWNSPARQAAMAAAGTVIFAGIDEMHQAFIPGRFAEIADFAADAAGAAAGIALFFLYKRYFSGHK